MIQHRPLFYSAAAFNVFAALPFLLAPDTVAPIMGLELNMSTRVLLQLILLIIISFGGVYALVARDPVRYRPYIPLGAWLKITVVVTFWGGAVGGRIGFGLPLLTLVDLLYAILFLLYFRRTRPTSADLRAS